MAIPFEIIRGPNFTSIHNLFSGVGGNIDVPAHLIFKGHQDRETKVKSIKFQGYAVNNFIVIKEIDENGPEICRLGRATAYETDRCYFGETGSYMKPFVDVSACILGAAGPNRIIFEFV